ncbi:MAG TPA: sugar transferase [Tepidisphaeraceae bacterium]|jgi:lipopolysaccharide/colanic/teichoic acid biosynthesis glycosyltransferase
MSDSPYPSAVSAPPGWAAPAVVVRSSSPLPAALASSGLVAAAAGNADVPPARPPRTIWGLDPQQLHTRYWAAHGVQVVRQGEPSEIVKHAELFLLTEAGSLALFSLSPLMDALNWIKPQVLFVRLHDGHERGYRENVVTDTAERFVKFQRVYDASSHLARVALTPDREIAQLWQSAPGPLTGWRRLRRFIRRHDRAVQNADGAVYDVGDDRELACFLHDLLLLWKRPDSTVLRVKSGGAEVWRDPEATIDPSARFIGPVWVGAGRAVEPGATVVGPAIIWDHPDRRPPIEEFQWLDIERAEPPQDPMPRVGSVLDRASKRAFDIVGALVGILFSLPLYPFIMLAIWLEDGRPFFFSHRRETLGGRDFPCVKFRSMRKDAEKMKALLQAKNQADGPQFYMEKDPRLTRVGAFLRRYNLDELPQFFNVLAGHMSIVGPRPSPHSENQYCPPWREARLSVRPGITGLWQVKRTRRTGTDFQEWIKYDIEYVEKRTFWLDLAICFRTFSVMLGKVSRS